MSGKMSVTLELIFIFSKSSHIAPYKLLMKINTVMGKSRLFNKYNKFDVKETARAKAEYRRDLDTNTNMLEGSAFKGDADVDVFIGEGGQRVERCGDRKSGEGENEFGFHVVVIGSFFGCWFMLLEKSGDGGGVRRCRACQARVGRTRRARGLRLRRMTERRC